MVRHHQISALIDHGLCQNGMYIVGGVGILVAPVELTDDELGAGIFELLDIGNSLILAADAVFALIDAGKADFYALDLHNGGVVVAKAVDSSFVQGGQGVYIALVAVILGVVIGNVHAVDAGLGENAHIGGVRLEGPFLVHPIGGGSEGALKICNGQIIPLKD